MDRKTGFEDKFLSKIGKIDRRRIRDYIAQLLSRKNFFETVFDHVNEAIIVTDEALAIAYNNQVARSMLMWPKRKQFFGESLPELCPQGELRDLLAAMRRRPRRLENHEIPFGAEGERQLSLTSIPVQAPEAAAGSGPRGTLWVFLLRDSTERRRRLEEEERSARLASLALLTSGVAHEIKNPLNSLNLHAQILLQEAQGAEGEAPKRETVERAARVILEESQRLTDIVNEFIQAARPQSPVLEPKYLNRIIEDLERVFRPECERLGIELALDLDHDLPPMGLDAPQMFQALRNLVRNAIEAHQEAEAKETKSGGATPRRKILLRTHQDGETATVDVIDNGPGIPEEHIEKIFEPYYTSKFGGTGLGLVVVYRVVAEHGGRIHVDSRPGVGTRFAITLPLAERRVRLLESPAAAQPASAA